MAKIIISYRRSDSDVFAGRVHDRLRSQYGNDSAFIDVDNIPFGTDFRIHIQQELANANAVLVIVGPKWLGMARSGRCRIMETTDPVRIEVETALSKGIPTIPILVGKTSMPKPEQLPDSLQNFAFINAAPVDTGRDFHRDLNRVMATVDQILRSRLECAVAHEGAAPVPQEGRGGIAAPLEGDEGPNAVVQSEDDPRRVPDGAAPQDVDLESGAETEEAVDGESRAVAGATGEEPAEVDRVELARNSGETTAPPVVAPAPGPARERSLLARWFRIGKVTIPVEYAADNEKEKDATRPFRAISIGGYLDNYLATNSLANIWGSAIIIALLLIWSSNFFGLDDIHAPPVDENGIARVACSSVGKQIGLWFAPNWSVVYLILFPLYLICMSLLAQHVRRMIADLEREMLLTPAHAAPAVKLNDVLAAELRMNNPFFYILVAGAVIMIFGGWTPTNGRSLWDFKLYDQVVDWSTVIIPCGWVQLKTGVLIYTLLAYIWMGFCLFVYLACLFLGFIYAFFLWRLSQGQIDKGGGAPWRLSLTKSLCRHLAKFVSVYFIACALGLVSGLCMRLEVEFLFSDKLNVVAYWLQDFSTIFSLWSGSPSSSLETGAFQTSRAVDQTSLTGGAVTIVTTICLIGATVVISWAFQNAKENALATMASASDIGILDRIQFIPSVIPHIGPMALIVAGIVFGTAFPSRGLVAILITVIGLAGALRPILSFLRKPATREASQ